MNRSVSALNRDCESKCCLPMLSSPLCRFTERETACEGSSQCGAPAALCAAAALGVSLIGAVFAQTTVRVRGTIERVDGSALTVKTREGAIVVVKVPDNVSVAGVLKRSLSDIKTK